MTQEQFLSNDRNKERLISLLIDSLESEGISVKHARENADHMIGTTAIEVTQSQERVALVGENTD